MSKRKLTYNMNCTYFSTRVTLTIQKGFYHACTYVVWKLIRI